MTLISGLHFFSFLNLNFAFIFFLIDPLLKKKLNIQGKKK